MCEWPGYQPSGKIKRKKATPEQLPKPMSRVSMPPDPTVSTITLISICVTSLQFAIIQHQD